MADLKITGLHKYYGHGPRRQRRRPGNPCGRVHRPGGQSGCGKSTLFRTIAGLEDADKGTIEIGGQVVNAAAAQARHRDGVPELRALSVHERVREHRLRSARAQDTARRDRSPRSSERPQMLASTICSSATRGSSPADSCSASRSAAPSCATPRLYLFDEPLSNLDAQLRDEMRGEIKRLHQELGKTMIYVTHDQIEAMTMADRIVLMRDGQIEQQGRRSTCTSARRRAYVAGFLGSPAMNFVPARSRDDGLAVYLSRRRRLLPLPARARRRLAERRDQAVLLGVRPEHMSRARRRRRRPGWLA